jgi:Cell division protein FtsI/penicillin-binding protein 2
MEKKKVFTRYTFLTMILIVIFLVISFRLADIQIVHGEDYRSDAQDKSIRTVDDNAPRGKILDRNKIELATNDQRYTIFMMKPQDKQEAKNLNQVIERLVDILNKDNEKINDGFNIAVKPNGKGGYTFEYDFPNSYTDEEQRKNYIKAATKRWIEDNHIADKNQFHYDYTAEQSFRWLQNKFEINPTQKEHQVKSDGSENVEFIRQMMAVRVMIENMGYMAYKPVDIAYVKKETAFEIMEKGQYLQGVDYKVEPVRYYPFGQLASTIIGSLRKIPSTKALEYKDRGYDVNVDLIGRDGIESFAENDLKGQKGGRTVRVDSNGRIVEELGKTDPVPGNNVVLTIDKDYQDFAEKKLDEIMTKLRNGEIQTRNNIKYTDATRGAAVVIDVKTGEVLAMASRPGGYDPNIMAATGSFTEDIRKILLPLNSEHPGVDPERILQPMFNYAVRGAAPPGSTFKVLTAIAGLETGVINQSTVIRDVGQYRVVPKFNGNCWIWNYYHGSHGNETVIGALKDSCNYFFFDVGRRLQLDNISKYAKMFGLSSDPTGIEVFEEPGNVANIPDIKENAVVYALQSALKDVTTPSYDAKAGTFNPTDDQKKVIESVIRNDKNEDSTALSTQLKNTGISSYKIRRRILDASLDVYNEWSKPGLPLNAAIGQGQDTFTPLQVANYIATVANGGVRMKPHLVKQIIKPDGTVIDTQPEVLEKINLKSNTLATVIAGMDAVTGEGGTAGSVFKNSAVKVAGKTGTAQAPGGRADYSWFAGFAPADNPQIAIAVVIHEGGGYGSSNVAKDLFDYYFSRQSSGTNPISK